MNSKVSISVIIPVTERYDDVAEVYSAYKRGLEKCSSSYEIIYVLDGAYPSVEKVLMSLREKGEPIKILCFARSFGESVALTAGFESATGGIILTLPAYFQIVPDEIVRLVEALSGYDVVTARRHPRGDGRFKIFQAKMFNGVLRFLLDSPFKDLGCSARVFRREVIEQVHIYGDQHRFLPLIAFRQGFTVQEIDVAQQEKDSFRRANPFGVYIRRLLDILTIYFLLKFTFKPLRFFGLVGLTLASIGMVLLAYIIFERLFLGVALGDRPIMLFASLMVVLGIQSIAVGLVGEIIIFANAGGSKEYKIQKVI